MLQEIKQFRKDFYNALYHCQQTEGDAPEFFTLENDEFIIQKAKSDDKDTNGDYVAKKVFHVSPFLEREGYYDFQFSLSDDSLKIHINLFDKNKERILLTSLSGKFDDLNSMLLKRAFFRVPFSTMKSIFLIHFQAVKLLLKKIKFISKPKQLDDRFTKNEKA